MRPSVINVLHPPSSITPDTNLVRWRSMDGHDRLVLLVDAAVISFIAVLALNQGDNKTFGKAGSQTARQIR